jgi:hypothetical protein
LIETKAQDRFSAGERPAVEQALLDAASSIDPLVQRAARRALDHKFKRAVLQPPEIGR